MKASDLVNVLNHLSPDTEVDDITLKHEIGDIAASAALENVKAGKHWADGAKSAVTEVK